MLDQMYLWPSLLKKIMSHFMSNGKQQNIPNIDKSLSTDKARMKHETGYRNRGSFLLTQHRRGAVRTFELWRCALLHLMTMVLV